MADDEGPLPPGWSTRRSKTRAGRIYYVNETLKKSTWKRPTVQSPSSPPAAAGKHQVTSPLSDPSPSPAGHSNRDALQQGSRLRAKSGPASVTMSSGMSAKKTMTSPSADQQWTPKLSDITTRRTPQRVTVTPQTTPRPIPKRVPITPHTVPKLTPQRVLVSKSATKATPQRVPTPLVQPKSATPQRVTVSSTPLSATPRRGYPISRGPQLGASPSLRPAPRKRHNFSGTEVSKPPSQQLYDTATLSSKSDRLQAFTLKKSNENDPSPISIVTNNPGKNSKSGQKASPEKKRKLSKSQGTSETLSDPGSTDRVLLHAKRSESESLSDPASTDRVILHAKRSKSDDKCEIKSTQIPVSLLTRKIPRKQQRQRNKVSAETNSGKNISHNNNEEDGKLLKTSSPCTGTKLFGVPVPMDSLPSKKETVLAPGPSWIGGASTLSQDPSLMCRQEARDEMDMEVEFAKASEDINQMRNALKSYNPQAVGDLTQSILVNKTSVAPSENKCSMYVVVDTNILIGGGVKDLNELKDKKFKGFGRPYLVIPWVVLQELDNYKDSMRLAKANIGLKQQLKATSAVQYLNRKLASQHPQFIFQTPEDAKEATRFLQNECNDDRVLQCCRHCCERYAGSHVVLLTQDVNLRTKAMVAGLKTCKLQDIVDYLQDLTSQGQRSPSPAMSSPCPSPPAPPLCQNPTAFTRLPIPTQWATVTSSLQACHKTRPGFPVSMSQDTGTGLSVPVSQNSFPTPSASPSVDKNKQEARMADDLLCDVKAALKDFLAVVLEEEMKLVYDDIWKAVVYRKPPWTLTDIVDSIKKHWIAVFGLAMPRCMKDQVEGIQEIMNKTYGMNLATVENLIAISMEFIENLPARQSYSSQQKTMMSELQQLRTKSTSMAPGGSSASQVVAERPTPTSVSQIMAERASSPPAAGQQAADAPATSGNQASWTSPTREAFMTDQEVNTVQQQFQLTYEAILSACECMGGVLTSTQGGMCPARQEALQFFHDLMQMLMSIEQSYKHMLSADHDSLDTFSVLCDTINRFAAAVNMIPWQPMDPCSLQRFYGDPLRQNILRNGYDQLINFLRELEALWMTLTPEERVVVQPNG